MIPFTYRGYWDLPRIIVFEADGALYCLDCKFSEELDDYPEYYELFRLSEERNYEGLRRSNIRTSTDLPDEWADLTAGAVHLGKVPVARVALDPTRRRHIAMTLPELLALAQQ